MRALAPANSGLISSAIDGIMALVYSLRRAAELDLCDIQLDPSRLTGSGDRFPVLFHHQFVQQVDDSLLKACSISTIGERCPYRGFGLWLDKEGDGGSTQAAGLYLADR